MAENNNANVLLTNEQEFLQSFRNEVDFSAIRKEAYSLWKKTPAPTSRDEYWKYTRLAPILKKTYRTSVEEKQIDSSILKELNCYKLVFVNGIFDSSHSTIIEGQDLILCDILSAKKNHKELINDKTQALSFSADYFSLLNDAFHQNGPFIWIGKNKVTEKPVRIINIINESERLVNIKGLIIAEENSKAVILETWENENSANNLLNSKSDYYLNQNSSLEVIKLQCIGAQNNLVNQEFVKQKGDSRFSAHTYSLGSGLIRNNMNASLDEAGAHSELNGLYTLKDSEHVDNHTEIIHAAPHCESHELYKGILNDKSKGVFNGKVIVARDSQKTNAFQYNGNILLTDDAEVYSKPELEIYADDVKCSHGSTTGQLDEEALFYLQARGIGKARSRKLLLRAFANEVLEKISVTEVKEYLENHIEEFYFQA